MKRRIKSYLKNGTMILGIALTLYGLFLSLKNDTSPITIQARVFWFILLGIIIVVVLLCTALYNQDKKLREADEYRIERYYSTDDKGALKISFIPLLNFDYLVTIAAEEDERETVLGIGKVVNIKRNCWIELKIIERKDNPLWAQIEMNDKSALNKAYILPTIKESEVVHK